MNYTEFKKQAALTVDVPAMPKTPNYWSPQQMANSTQAKQVDKAVAGISGTSPTMATIQKPNYWSKEQINQTAQSKAPVANTQPAPKPEPQPQAPQGYSVPVDALKDPNAAKQFLKNLPSVVENNTSIGGKVDAVGWQDAAAKFIKDHPVITSLVPLVGPVASTAVAVTGAGNVSNEDKAAVFQKFKEENPDFMPSLVEAVKGGSPDAIKELQKLTSEGTGASLFNEAEMKELTGAAQSASWNAIKSDPFGNLPKVMGLFLRQHGMGSMADYAENPLIFYGGLLALLFGGGALISGGNNQPAVVNNYYGAQQPAGYNRIPYT